MSDKKPTLTKHELEARTELRAMIREYFDMRQQNNHLAEKLPPLMAEKYPVPKNWHILCGEAFAQALATYEVQLNTPGFLKLSKSDRRKLLIQPFQSAAQALVERWWGMTT